MEVIGLEKEGEKEEEGIVVKIARLGEAVIDAVVKQGSTVEQVLVGQTGEIEEGMEIRVNGEERDLNEPLKDGDIITVIPNIKGGQ